MSEHRIAIGIDPSIAGTCVCLGTSEKLYRIQRFPSESQGRVLADRFQRYEETIGRVMQWIEEELQIQGASKPVVFIEGYSFASKFGGEFLAEYGGLLRWHLVEDYTAHEVAPLRLKQFVTGKGAGKKEMMIAHLSKDHQVTFPTNDHYDAFGLYLMALGSIGKLKMTQAQKTAVDKVTAVKE